MEGGGGLDGCHALSDSRLNEVSGQTRGCGGVAILWKKELLWKKASSAQCPGNGRLCCVKIQLSDCSYLMGTLMSINPVYLIWNS